MQNDKAPLNIYWTKIRLRAGANLAVYVVIVHWVRWKALLSVADVCATDACYARIVVCPDQSVR